MAQVLRLCVAVARSLGWLARYPLVPHDLVRLFHRAVNPVNPTPLPLLFGPHPNHVTQLESSTLDDPRRSLVGVDQAIQVVALPRVQVRLAVGPVSTWRLGGGRRQRSHDGWRLQQNPDSISRSRLRRITAARACVGCSSSAGLRSCVCCARSTHQSASPSVLPGPLPRSGRGRLHESA